VLWAIDNLPVILVVRKSLGIDRISDLKGHRIVPGGAGSSLERTAPEVYERLGAKPQWRRASWGQIGYMLVSNQADGFVGSLTMLESVKSEYGMPELKVIRLSATEIAMLDSMHPDISLGIVMYEGLPVSGWKMRSAVISRNLPSHHAETLAKAAINISLAGPFRDKGRPYRIDESTLDMKVHNHPASLHVLSAQPQ